MASCRGAYYDGVLRVIWAGRPAVVLIAGEVDESTYSGLVSTLEDLAGRDGDVHVDLADLAYCDLAGLRAILRLAGTGRGDEGRGGRCLVLHGVPPYLRMVLEILGWASTPGLIIETAQLTASPSEMVAAAPASNGAAIASTAPVSAPDPDYGDRAAPRTLARQTVPAAAVSAAVIAPR